ncbi:hypothetical protein AB6D34_02480 [Pectobacterium brasiliense]|uniref:CRISPR-associated protein n=1 Tax=Pectobacterium brasiliense TaxID=180957 RepID=A0A3S0XY15_9GAMM|nr:MULTISPECIES: hypothetical protein [Pectobacterium]GKW28536.1 hypothetical protein PEC331060_17140 [Pectobacterium carotovorum subsp. carotovorum]MBN3046115.1 hypothetical protein [Pectobacterium brasiliense]MBN3076394.1 hypothetical protein [Pectobacterium brasiliense]MBN3085352.1 hypothetical protein [Pectobacterium brasiliense]MBN3087933.1 hypothetical protein [Pectobacterium brasiliense]
MIDYSVFYKRHINTERIEVELPSYDVFISAYNSSYRVNKVYDAIKAVKKIWLIHPEYNYSQIEYPNDNPKVCPDDISEINQVRKLLEEVGDIEGKTICIDTTGFMRHVLVFLIASLHMLKVKNFTALYSEPLFYEKQGDTSFSTATTGKPATIKGTYQNKPGTDHLIINVGYDHKLIGEIVENKEGAKIYPIFSFPSLSADMYQQSAIRASKAGSAAQNASWINNRHFSPANDPFTNAAVISEIVRSIDESNHEANIYLSPLSTKIQTLGAALYWILEGKTRGGVSIFLPECLSYSRETSSGLKRLWSYDIEFF